MRWDEGLEKAENIKLFNLLLQTQPHTGTPPSALNWTSLFKHLTLFFYCINQNTRLGSYTCMYSETTQSCVSHFANPVLCGFFNET